MAYYPKASGGTPGGSTTQVQFNDSGAFNGDSQILVNKTNHILDFGGVTSSFSGLKQSASAIATNRLSVRLGDDSDWGFLALTSFDVMQTGTSIRSGIVGDNGSGMTIASLASLPLILDGTNSGGRGDIQHKGSITDGSYSFQTPTTGFSITLSNTIWHTILDPAGTLATGTITMPSTPQDGMVVNVRSSQIITSLTVSPNSGQSVKAAPTTLAAGGTFEAIYRAANTTWYF